MVKLYYTNFKYSILTTWISTTRISDTVGVRITRITSWTFTDGRSSLGFTFSIGSTRGLAARLEVAIDKWVSDITYNMRSVINFKLFKGRLKTLFFLPD